jgi:hypothetical protein
VTERPKVQHWKNERAGSRLTAENTGNHVFYAARCTSRPLGRNPTLSLKTGASGCHDNRLLSRDWLACMTRRQTQLGRARCGLEIIPLCDGLPFDVSRRAPFLPTVPVPDETSPTSRPRSSITGPSGLLLLGSLFMAASLLVWVSEWERALVPECPPPQACPQHRDCSRTRSGRRSVESRLDTHRKG